MIRRLIVLLAFFLAPLAAFGVEMGDDGLHKQPWFKLTFKDMAEDLQSANAEGKRLAVIYEQRGCIYCRRMHEEVFSDAEVATFVSENFYVVQMNLFGDEEVTDFDGTSLPEKEMARRWGVVFTPTVLFFDDKPPAEGGGAQAVVSTLPGAFGKGTVLSMFRWVQMKGYESGEHFQKFHMRELEKRNNQ